ncbi:lyase family protein [Pectobacterium brasiliense]|uniref:lyase family protein n=1 Tax=Pectobacterium brasiliense TaxID=180957 RepID=UPI003872ED0E
MSTNIRIEEDLLGTREVPADAYYGIHTLRAIENFYISNSTISDIPEFVRAMVMVKKAAALANKELQTIPRKIADTILQACDEVLNNGKCLDQFLSMSIRAAQVRQSHEHQRSAGEYRSGTDGSPERRIPIPDRTTLNKCQSTNDAYPTGFRIAVYTSILKLVEAITQLSDGFERKRKSLKTS